MCYGGMSLRDTLRDVEARVAPLARALDEVAPVSVAKSGWLARLRGAMAAWMRRGVRA
jgi:hypothetical protein